MTNPVSIIMVEDDEGHARLIERNIRRSGVNNEIMPFTDGTSAVNYLFGKDGTGSAHKGQALLVLLDLNLPDMTGIDVLKRIRENPATRGLPVVVLTSSQDREDIQSAYQFGANSFVSKSETPELMFKRLRMLPVYWLELNQLPRDLEH